MIIQNTKEWLELRKTKIGASDANIIMGVSKFCTAKELLSKKLGLVEEEKNKNTYITDKGHRLEEKMRAMIELETDLDFPDVVAVSKNFPWLMASLDGYNDKEKIVLECKYVGADDFETVKRGFWLEKYYPQIQQQLFVTDAQKCILMVCKEDKEKNLDFAKVEIKYNKDYFEKQMFPKLNNFYEKMQSGKNDIEMTKGDNLDQSDDKELCDMLNVYKIMVDEQKKLNDRVSELKDNIFAKIKHTNVKCNDAQIKLVNVKGRETFDYKRYFKSIKAEPPKEFLKIGKESQQKRISFVQ